MPRQRWMPVATAYLYQGSAGTPTDGPSEVSHRSLAPQGNFEHMSQKCSRPTADASYGS